MQAEKSYYTKEKHIPFMIPPLQDILILKERAECSTHPARSIDIDSNNSTAG